MVVHNNSADKQALDKLKAKIQDNNLHSLNAPPIKHSIYLFISFDIVNSTQLKSDVKNAKLWPYIFTFFYQTLSNNMKHINNDIEIWKYIGDEILFYLQIRNIDILYDIPKKIFTVQEILSKKIKEKTFKDAELNIKSTIWVAGITERENISIQNLNTIIDSTDTIYRNIKYYLRYKQDLLCDFLGPDIDTGFRIAKYANKHKLTISAEYAYILLRMATPQRAKNIEKYIKIVSFESLKGVWHDRAYPIIWYYPNWDNVAESFDYDEYKNNDIIKNIHCKKEIQFLETVFDQLEITTKMNSFVTECLSLKQ